MAQETVGISININNENAVKSIKELRQEVAKTEQELSELTKTYGENSEQVAQKSKQLQGLQSQFNESIEKQNLAIENAGKTISGLSAAYGGLQGALELTGLAGEDTIQQLAKIQSAIAIGDGIKNLIEFRSAIASTFGLLINSLKSSTAFQKINNALTITATAVQKAFGVATVQTSIGFKLLKTAIAATGIGLLVVGLTALINKIQDWVGSTDDATLSNEQLNEALEEQNRIFDKNRQKIQQAREDAIADAKIKGKTAEEIFKINKEFSQKDIDEAQRNFNEKKKILDEYTKNNLETFIKDGKLRVSGSEKDIEQYKKLRDEFENADKELSSSRRKLATEDQQENIRLADEARAKQKESNDKSKALIEKNNAERIAANEQADQQIRSQQQENFLLSIKDENEKAKKKLDFDLQNRILEIDALNADESKKKELRLQAIKSTALEIANLEEQIKQEKKEKEEEETKERQEREKKNEEDRAARIRQQYEYDKKTREEFEQAELEATKFLQEQKVALVDAGINLISALAGKNEKVANVFYAIQKAVEIGRIITSTTGAIAKIKADTAAIPAFIGPGIPNPAFIAATLAGTKKILGLKIGAATSIASIAASSISKFIGGGGGSIGGTQDTGSIGIGSAPLTPNAPIQNTLTQLDQATINRLGSASNRAYVLESDVTNSQERIIRINRAARLG